MSQDDSFTTSLPEPSETDESRGGLTGQKLLYAGLAVVLVLGALIFVVLRGGEDEATAGDDCVENRLRLTTAPALKELVDKAVKSAEQDVECVTFEVTEGTVKDVLAVVSDPQAQVPDLWIPDSPTWKGQLAAAGWQGTPVADVIAQTPVGLVSGPAANPPESWSAALADGRLAMSDPSADGASALALLAPYAESRKTGATPEEIKAQTVPVAQAYGERAVAGAAGEVDPAALSTTSTELIPVTEEAYLAARRQNGQVTLIAPRTGVPMLQFPIIDVHRANLGLDVDHGDVSPRAGRAIAHWFASSEGEAAVLEAEFRTADGAALAGGVGMGAAQTLRKVDQKTTDDVLRNWRVVSVPSSILAVADLSGSMKQSLGSVTRIQLAANAAQVALGALPDHARVGLWGFSKNRGGEGQSWQEYVALAPLGSEAEGGITHREFLAADSRQLPSRVRGATGLMDTTLAAYKDAQAKWDPAYFNAVVIFTDGASDDTSNLTITALVEQLKSLRDPSKPVKVIVIGISQDADSPELAQIAAATGGQNFLVTNPDDILGVLASALLNR